MVTLTVATHEDTLTVPDVYGKDANIAKQELSLAKLVPVIVSVDDSTVDEGKVVRTSPERGDSVTAGDTVQVFVSTGKSGNEVKVPYIVDISYDDAKAQLESMELGIRIVKEVDSDKAEGIILSQSIEKDSTVAKGTIIDVEVSSGKKPANTVNISFNLPNLGSDGELKAFLDNELVSTTQVLLNGNSYNKISVSGTSTNAEFTVTINGTTYYKCNVNFETGTVSNEQYKEMTSNAPDTGTTNADQEDNGHPFWFGE